MITELIVQAITGLVGGFISLLPTYKFDPGPFTETAGDMGGWAGGLNGYAPMQQLALAIAIIVSLKLAIMVWDAAFFVYHQFWGSK